MKHLTNLATGEVIAVKPEDVQPLIDTLKYVTTSKSRYKSFLKEQAKRMDRINRGVIKLKNLEAKKKREAAESQEDTLSSEQSEDEHKKLQEEAELLASPEEVEKLKQSVNKIEE